ncbi:MAG: GspE/PulE family protein [Phycisphaerales bacterium]
MSATAGQTANGAPAGRSASPGYRPGAFRDHLLASGELTEADWRLAREVAKQNGTSDVRAILDLGLLTEEAIAQHLGDVLGLPRWNPKGETRQLSADVPREFMRSSGVLVLETRTEGEAPADRQLVVADLSDHHTTRALGARFAGVPVAVGTHKQMAAFLEEHAHDEDPDEHAADERLDIAGELSALRDMASDAPVVRFFNQCVERALDLGASDIHLERYDRRVSLRYRVDGMLAEAPAPQASMYEALLCRIKIMSDLDIAERRLAQDGRIQMRFRGRQVDMRVSIVPTTYGQDAAIRIQDRQKLATIELDDLGFDASDIGFLKETATRDHGILLITGPTGSGKTTTLYALLRAISTVQRKTVTVEDPVEYSMDGITQIQVNGAIGLNFSTTLRHILRHDPDVILIGEIRDAETAEIAFQASLTGHLVLSTLHTNDVPSTFVRLVDMGIEPYLVNAAVEGVTAQRLVRLICASCGNDHERRESCEACNGLGYRGREAVMEYSGVTERVKDALVAGAQEQDVRRALVASGFRSMRDRAKRLLETGRTDEAELTRVLGHVGASGDDSGGDP